MVYNYVIRPKDQRHNQYPTTEIFLLTTKTTLNTTTHRTHWTDALETYPVGDNGAAGLLHENLGEWADAIRSYIKTLRQLVLIHAST